MTAGDEPATKAYNFTSYSADGETEYATGVAETTGNTKTFNGQEYTEVEVKENTIPEWVGMKFYIISTAQSGQKYDLYDQNGGEVGVKVMIGA